MTQAGPDTFKKEGEWMMNALPKTPIGIDISKNVFDAALFIAGDMQQLQFKNNSTGFRQFQAWLKKRKIMAAHVCMEATGRYADQLARFMVGCGYEVSVVNPKRIKAYGESKLTRNKTDELDAVIIEDFCRTQRPRLWQPPAVEIETLQMMTRHLEALKNMRTQELNRLKSGVTAPIIREMIEKHIAYLDEAVHQLEAKIAEHIDKEPGLKAAAELLESIPGIGRLTASILLAEIKDISHFECAAQLASYAGLSPQKRQSGTSVRGRSRLCKIGNASLRKAIFLPAMTARQHNPVVREFSLRLAARGKEKMVIQGAAMRKLLHLVFGVWKHAQPFDAMYEQRRLAMA